jgi:hypothetical protein
MIPERERAGVLIRLFAALFLLLPGLALVASAYRHAHPTTTAVVVFVVVHAALHMLACVAGSCIARRSSVPADPACICGRRDVCCNIADHRDQRSCR